jgi:hypothetical protein
MSAAWQDGTSIAFRESRHQGYHQPQSRQLAATSRRHAGVRLSCRGYYGGYKALSSGDRNLQG